TTGVLTFPTIQTCEKGETAWTEVAPEGSTQEPQSPAPAITVTAAAVEGTGEEAGDGAVDTAGDDGATTTADSGAAEAPSDDSAESNRTDADQGGNVWGGIGAGAGVLGLIAGVTALVMGR